MDAYILGIESSCDDTSAAVAFKTKILANIIANQQVHEKYGGVVPELASRAHQQNIIPVVEQALQTAGIVKEQLQAVAFTAGPGLLGSLLVGSSFAKAFAFGLGIPLIEVDHMQAHILAHFIDDHEQKSDFPFLCLTVSGGHTQIVRVDDYFTMTVIGRTFDDAAGEAFDKTAKILGLPYPGGPLVDKLAQHGKPVFQFSKAQIPGLDFSFSGLKTSLLYFVRDHLKSDPDFIEKNQADICASMQKAIIDSLLEKVILASHQTGINHIALAGGVSANSGLRNQLKETGQKLGWKVYIPKIAYCTDNAAMIAVAGYFKFLKHEYSEMNVSPYSRAKK